MNDRTIAISHTSDVAVARVHARGLATAQGLERRLVEAFATAVSELATNIMIHAGSGEIELTAIAAAERRGVRAVARDEGPGIADLDRALTDGFSTSGGMGCGLPGARRLADRFELRSRLGGGTTVLVEKWA